MAKSLDLNVVLAARDKITAPLKRINASSSATAKSIKRSQQEIKELKARQKDLGAFRKMRGALNDNTKALDESQERVRKLGLALQNTKKPTEQMRRQYKKARDDVEKFTRKGQDQRRELGRVQKSLKDSGVDTRNLGAAQSQLDSRMRDANKRIQRQQKYLAQLGKADLGGNFRKMTGEVTRFSRRAGMAFGGMAAGIFGLANSTASLGDDVAKTSSKIGIAVGPFQELRYAAERSGVSTQKFDSSLERFVKRMGEARQGTGAARKAYDELGLSAADLAKLTPEKSLSVVADRLSSVENQSQRVALAAQLFGREGVGMINMLKDGSAGLKELRADARLTGYALSEQAAKDAEKFKDSLLNAQLGMKGMKNIIGAELMPAVTELMTNLSVWMQENRDRVKAFAATFGDRLKNALPILRDIGKGAASTARTFGLVTNKLATLVGGFDNLGIVLAGVVALKPILAIGGMAKALFLAGSAAVGLVSSLGAVGAALKVLKIVMISTGIGALIAGIGAAAYLIYKNWDGIAGWFKNLWGSVKQAFSGGISGIGKLILNWSPLGLFYKAFSGVLGWFGIELPGTLTDAGGKMIGGLASGIKSMIGLPLRALSGLWGGIKSAFSGGISGIGKLILNWSPLGLFYKAFSGVLNWFGADLPSTFTGFGGQILDGLVSGLTGGLKKVKDTIVNAGAKTIGWFKETLGIKSPSRVFMAAGNDTLEGYRKGLKQKEPAALKDVSQFGKRVRNVGAGVAMGAAAMPVAADVQIDNRKPISSPAQSVAQAAPANQGDTIIHFNITGNDPMAIASEVKRAMQQVEREKARRAGSALYDRE